MVPLAIDEFPVLFIAACCAAGETRPVTGAEELAGERVLIAFKVWLTD